MQTNKKWMPAAKITLLYLVFGAIWILGSDLALIYMIGDERKVIALQTIKGWFYIFTTSGVLFWLLIRHTKKVQDTEERWRLALDGSGDGVWDWDASSNTVWFSEQWKNILGYKNDEIGTSLDEWSSRVHPDDMAAVMEDLQPHLDGKTPTYVNEHRVRCKDGSYKWILDRGQVIYRDASGNPLRVVGTHTDITEQRLAHDRLKLAATVFTHAREGIIITDSEARILDINTTFSEITGFSREEVLGQTPAILKSGKHSPEFYERMWLEIHTNGHWSGEVWNRRKDGEAYIELLTISAVNNNAGKTINYVALFSDITHIKEHQKQLEFMANFDTLTKLPNRVLLADRLRQAMLHSQRNELSLAVVFIDLDDFKHVNDRHGHTIGDKLLIDIAGAMTKALREGDTLARIGGDEFVAVLPELTKTQDCESILDRLVAAASSPVTIENKPLKVSASIGVTFYPQENVDADILIRHADQAMYTAKELGGNCYSFFDTQQADDAKEQREKLLTIHQALKDKEFILHYQPQVNMRTGEITGLEALVRWQTPEQGLLPPSTFLPYIENNSIIIELGEKVIDMALRQIRLWQTSGVTIPPKIGVNISALQLTQPDFAERLASLLDAYPDVAPSYLELEVLETSALNDIDRVSATMKACLELGVKFAIDDFGTGYSSLTYLKHLPVSLIKVDQSFVRNMLTDSDDLAIVSGVIGLSISFKQTVIAEGVETLEHGKKLLDLGCELAQGYGIAKPMPAEAFPTWIDEWKSNIDWLTLRNIE